MKLLYNKAARNWNEAMPLGNGFTGVMLYGGRKKDKLCLNEDTLWSGYPKDDLNNQALDNLNKVRELIFNGNYKEGEALISRTSLGNFSEAYQPLGNLYINFYKKPKGRYKRCLNLSTAVACVTCGEKEKAIVREYFCSYKYKCFIIRINSKKNISITLSYKSKLKSNVLIKNDALILEGNAPDVSLPVYVKDDYPIRYDDKKSMAFSSVCDVLTNGKKVCVANYINIENATHIDIIVHIKTGYKGFNVMPEHNKEIVTNEAINELNDIKKTSIDQIQSETIEEYSKEFNKSNFAINGVDLNSEIDVVKHLKKAKTEPTNELTVAYFEFSKMLYLASSRKGSTATNLQGIWNKHLRAPWSSNYTVNINTQMNYWLQNKLGLFHCFEPMATLIDELSVNGTEIALKQYGIEDAFVTNHNTDIWKKTTPAYGYCAYAYYALAGGWLATHIYDYYEYTKDIKFLEKYLHIIFKSAKFAYGWLVQNNGEYTVCPSTSPENTFKANGERYCVSYGSTHELAVVKQNFSDYLNAINEFSKIRELTEKEKALKENILKVQDKISSFKISKDGRLQEWSEDYEENEKGHRHFSHLVAFFPFDRILYHKDKELTNAVLNSVNFRCENGSGYTGWSAGWVINLYARLHEKEKMYSYIKRLFKNSTYKNLFDKHPPFQIDGNFGASCGFLEALVQSEENVLEFLPALPNAWKDGEINGVIAKGGYSINMRWKNYKIEKLEILSNVNDKIAIRVGENVNIFKLEKGIFTKIFI